MRAILRPLKSVVVFAAAARAAALLLGLRVSLNYIASLLIDTLVVETDASSTQIY